MASPVVLPPSEAHLRACDLVEEGIELFLSARQRARFGRLEAPLEAFLQLILAVRQLEGLATLGRTDLVLVPPAAAVARSAFEASVRAMWLVTGSTEMDGEARWLAHLGEEADMWRRMSRLSEQDGISDSFVRRADGIEAFRLAVSAKLPQDVVIPKVPNVRQILRELGHEEKYVHYVHLSQFAHATHSASGTYRRNLGTDKTLGEFATGRDWWWLFSASWPPFQAAVELVLGQVEVPLPVYGFKFVSDIQDAITSLRGPLD